MSLTVQKELFDQLEKTRQQEITDLLRKLENSIGNGAIKVESSLEVGSTKLNL